MWSRPTRTRCRMHFTHRGAVSTRRLLTGISSDAALGVLLQLSEPFRRERIVFIFVPSAASQSLISQSRASLFIRLLPHMCDTNVQMLLRAARSRYISLQAVQPASQSPPPLPFPLLTPRCRTEQRSFMSARWTAQG